MSQSFLIRQSEVDGEVLPPQVFIIRNGGSPGRDGTSLGEAFHNAGRIDSDSDEDAIEFLEALATGGGFDVSAILAAIRGSSAPEHQTIKAIGDYVLAALSLEAAARTQADTSIVNALTQEAITRAQAVADEASARATGDTAIVGGATAPHNTLGKIEADYGPRIRVLEERTGYTITGSAGLVMPDNGFLALGYDTPGDAPVMSMKQVANGTTGAGVRVFGAKTYQLDTSQPEFRQFGGKMGAVDTGSAYTGTIGDAAMAELVAYATLKSTGMLLPPGDMVLGATVLANQQQLFNTGAMTQFDLEGAGPGRTRIFLNEPIDAVVGGAHLFGNISTDGNPYAKGRHRIRGITIRGRHHHNPTWTGWGAFQPQGWAFLDWEDFSFEFMRQKCMRAQYCGGGRFTNFEGNDLAKGMLRGVAFGFVIISNGKVDGTGDDVFDFPQINEPIGVSAGLPGRSDALINNIDIRHCEGALMAGGRRVIFSNYKSDLSHGGALGIVPGRSQGSASETVLILNNCTITDPLQPISKSTANDLSEIDDDTKFAAVSVGAPTRSATSTNVPPRDYDPASKRVIPLVGDLVDSSITTITGGQQPFFGTLYAYDVFANDESDTSVWSSAGGLWLLANGFTVTRTRNDTDNFWNGAFGYFFDPERGRLDGSVRRRPDNTLIDTTPPKLRSANWMKHAVASARDFTGAIFNNYHIEGLKTGAALRIRLAHSLDPTRSIDKFYFGQGTVTDMRNLISVDVSALNNPATPYRLGLVIDGANVDLDPGHDGFVYTYDDNGDPIISGGDYIVTPRRLYDGTGGGPYGTGAPTGGWVYQDPATYDGAFAVLDVAHCTDWVARNVKFKNCYTFAKSSPGMGMRFDNICECQPVAIGWSANNLGVGVIDYASAETIHVIKYCDRRDPNYGRTITEPVRVATSVPSSGFYVTGHRIENPMGGFLRRANVGSGAALGTDWIQESADDPGDVATAFTALVTF